MPNRRHCHRAAPVAYRTAARPNKPAGVGVPRTLETHQTNALRLIKRAENGIATTLELAHDLELSPQYLGVILRNLELEGRLKATTIGRNRGWQLAC